METSEIESDIFRKTQRTKITWREGILERVSELIVQVETSEIGFAIL